MKEPIEDRIERLQGGGIIDMHFDLPMDLYEKRERRDVLGTEFLPEFQAGSISVVGAAIYIEDRYLPHSGLRVALDQIARLYAETAASERLAICRGAARLPHCELPCLHATRSRRCPSTPSVIAPRAN